MNTMFFALLSAAVAGIAMAQLNDHLGLFGPDRAPVNWWKGFGLSFLAGGYYFMLCK